MKKWQYFDKTWVCENVSKAGNTRFVVCVETMGTRGERELARFKTRAEAVAFAKGMAMAKM